MHVIGFGGVRVRINRIAFLLDPPQLGVPHHDGIDHGDFLECELILAQLAHAFTRVDADIAGSRLQIAAKDLHEGGFAGTIGADQAVPVAVAELHRNVFEQRPCAELHRDVCSSDHNLS